MNNPTHFFDENLDYNQVTYKPAVLKRKSVRLPNINNSSVAGNKRCRDRGMIADVCSC